MYIPVAVKQILQRFNENNFEAYIVGGCVRDSLLGKVPYDWDICTSALPDVTMRLFKDYKLVLGGKKYGTIMVIIDSIPYEITTFRIEGNYQDSRHPDSVNFSNSINEDLKRRDFTMNAIAYNEKFVDLYDGIGDIKKSLIKSVGNPDNRFKEDPLRILRALRFSSQLGFNIESKTKESIIEHQNLLLNISKERIFCELEKLFLGQHSQKVINEFEDVLTTVLFNSVKFDKWNIIVSHINKLDNIVSIYSFIAHFVENKIDFINNLYLSKKDKNSIKEITELLNIEFQNNKPFIKKLLKQFEVGNIIKSLDLHQILDDTNIKSITDIIDEIIKNNECFTIKQLAINGNDLIDIGITKNNIGKTLNHCLDLIINEQLENDKNQILAYISNNL